MSPDPTRNELAEHTRCPHCYAVLAICLHPWHGVRAGDYEPEPMSLLPEMGRPELTIPTWRERWGRRWGTEQGTEEAK